MQGVANRAPRIKFCGITSVADAELAVANGAWAIGLIHHSESPRFVEPAVAEEIGAALKRRCEVAGVFVNSPIEDVVRAAEREQLLSLLRQALESAPPQSLWSSAEGD